jgi:hypothetical protein
MNDFVGTALVLAAAIGMLATLLILRRERHEGEARTTESQFAASTEGEKICPKCRMGNLWTDRTCVACGNPLRG